MNIHSSFALTAHFVNGKDADEFGKAIREVLGGKSRLKILRIVERASIIRVWRAWRRKRKSEKEIKRVFGKG